MPVEDDEKFQAWSDAHNHYIDAVEAMKRGDAGLIDVERALKKLDAVFDDEKGR